MARGGALGSPMGCGDVAHAEVEKLVRRRCPVLALIRSTSSASQPMMLASSAAYFRLGGGQIDLVEHRDDLQVVLDGEVEVGQRLRLDALGGVDEQDRALAGGERARDLVSEVHVAGGVDQVQFV